MDTFDQVIRERLLDDLVRKLAVAGLLSDPRVRALVDFAELLMTVTESLLEDATAAVEAAVEDEAPRSTAVEWLRELLEEHGILSKPEVMELAKADGFGRRIIEDAATKLDVQRDRVGRSVDWWLPKGEPPPASPQPRSGARVTRHRRKSPTR